MLTHSAISEPDWPATVLCSTGKDRQMNSEKKDRLWQDLAQQIAEEKDPEKVVDLASKLIRALDNENPPGVRPPLA